MPVAPQPPATTNPGGRGGQAHEFFGVNERELTTIDGAARHGEAAGRLTAALLVAALAAGALQQGGFFERGQVSVAALLAAALVSALPIDRASEPTLRLALAAGVLAAGWALVRAFPSGSLRAAAGEAFLLTALGVVVALTRRLDEPGRRLAVAGVLGVGVVLAATAWIGVVWRVTPWALTSAGLWRGASTITYANATGCLLAVLALTCLALLGRDRRSLPLNVVLTLLLIGLVTTLSRAAALSFVVGLAVLVLLRGTIVLRALAGPLLGTAIASVFLLPSIPASNQPRPLLGLGGLVIGVALAAAVAAAGRRATVAMAVAVLAVATVGLTRPGVSPSLDAAGNRLSASRLEVGSPARSRLHETALDLFGSEPLVGVGPGRFVRESKKHGELHVQGYVHDEYAQLLAEQGVIGAALGVVVLIALARVLLKGRLEAPSPVLWASCVASLVAVSVHAGFDFVWHVPLVLICLALLLGLAVKPATSTNEVA
jgi:O-antigen ligase